MDDRYIGFFDSGIGGLTAVTALRELLPKENIVYFADTARCPYGIKTIDQLRTMAKENLDYLKSFNTKVILAACGTISANASDVLNSYEIKTFNVLDPAVEAMSKIEGNGALVVLATEASIKSKAFQNGINARCNKEVIGIACQDFVKLAESNHFDEHDELLIETVDKYLLQVKNAKIDAVLLGCTHFGYMKKAIQNYLPESQIVSASEEAAKVVSNYLKNNDMLGGSGEIKVFSSGYEVCYKT